LVLSFLQSMPWFLRTIEENHRILIPGTTHYCSFNTAHSPITLSLASSFPFPTSAIPGLPLEFRFSPSQHLHCSQHKMHFLFVIQRNRVFVGGNCSHFLVTINPLESFPNH
jgi:hypothetical protein